MNFNFLENLSDAIDKTLGKAKENKSINTNDVSNKDITQDEIDVAQKLDAIVEYTLDRFEDNIAVCENRLDGKIINIERDKLPENISEGDVFKEINGKYFVDEKLNEDISKRIQNKMDNLWN